MTSKDALSIGSDTKPPVLYRGEYGQWKKRFLHFILSQHAGPDILDSLTTGPAKFYRAVAPAPNSQPALPGGVIEIPPAEYTQEQKDRARADVYAHSYMLQGITNEIYSSLDSFGTGKELWDEIQKQMEGTDLGNKAKMVSTLNTYGQFKATQEKNWSKPISDSATCSMISERTNSSKRSLRLTSNLSNPYYRSGRCLATVRCSTRT